MHLLKVFLELLASDNEEKNPTLRSTTGTILSEGK